MAFADLRGAGGGGGGAAVTPSDQEKSITLLVQAHGLTTISAEGPVPRSKHSSLHNVKVLSIVGRELIQGEMGLTFDPRYNGLTTDAMVGTKLWEVYRHPSRVTFTKNKSYYDSKLVEASRVIKELNETARIKFPEGYLIEENPVLSRTYFFEPNDHEDHRLCIEKGDAICTTARLGAGIVWCPFYGLFVLDATDPGNDLDSHTIASMSASPTSTLPPATLQSRFNTTPEGFKNIGLRNVLREDQLAFWEGRITAHLGVTVPPNPKCEEIIQLLREGRVDKQLSLEDIVTIFQEGMGYTHVFVIDPTCKTPYFESPSSSPNPGSTGSQVPASLSSLRQRSVSPLQQQQQQPTQSLRRRPWRGGKSKSKRNSLQKRPSRKWRSLRTRRKYTRRQR